MAITIRNATSRDLTEVERLEEEVWPEGTRAPLEKFKSRLQVFQKGFLLAYSEGKLIGASTSQIIDYDEQESIGSWEEITDNGWIRNSHIEEGNALYVVSLGAISRSGGGSALLQAQKSLATKLNLEYLVLGSRIPGYDHYCREYGEIPIEEYVRLQGSNGELLDPELRFYKRNGLSLSKIISNYMEDDRESRNHGAIMVWTHESPKSY